MNPIRRHRTLLLVLPAAALALTLGACAGSGSDDKTMSTDAGGTSAAEPPAAAADGDAALTYRGATTDELLSAEQADGTTKNVVPAASAPAPAQQAVIRTGELQLESEDPVDARTDVLSIVRSLNGTVADEQSTSDDKGELEQVDLTLRVPVASFDQALDRFSGLGTVTHRQQSAEDVTTQVIDTDARVKAQAASVESIQRLLAKATTIGEIMAIEGQLTRRQAELDSLTQQQKYLKDQTSLSTIHVTVSRPAPVEDDEAGGFVGGLEDGWDALVKSVEAISTGLGAVLPFAALFALIGVPVWLLVRRNRAGGPAAPANLEA